MLYVSIHRVRENLIKRSAHFDQYIQLNLSFLSFSLYLTFASWNPSMRYCAHSEINPMQNANANACIPTKFFLPLHSCSYRHFLTYTRLIGWFKTPYWFSKRKQAIANVCSAQSSEISGTVYSYRKRISHPIVRRRCFTVCIWWKGQQFLILFPLWWGKFMCTYTRQKFRVSQTHSIRDCQENGQEKFKSSINLIMQMHKVNVNWLDWAVTLSAHTHQSINIWSSCLM